MIVHTLVFSFPSAMTAQDREQFFTGIEALMMDEGKADKFEHWPHVAAPEDQYAPVFAATDIVQLTFREMDTLNAASAQPALNEFRERWQSKFPYKLVWVNREPES